MKTHARVPVLIAVLSLFLLAAPRESSSQEAGTVEETPAAVEPSAPEKEKAPARGDEIIVIATKSDINKRETGASVTIITEKELEQRGEETVIGALRDVPGLNIVQESVFGGKASVFIRGGKSGNVLVLIDGVEANDPSNPDRSYDFANLTTDNVERIEILRGPQSTLYGSDATGGVINIITKKGSGKPRLSIKAEAGTYSTFKGSMSVYGGTDEANYSFAVARTDAKGFSQAAKDPEAAAEPEKDGYANTIFSSRMGFRVLGNSWIDFALRYNDSEADIDDGSFLDDPNNMLYTKNLTSVAAFEQPIAKWWKHSISVSYADNDRKQRDEGDSVTPTESIDSWFQGNQKKAEWQHNFQTGEFNEVTGGVAYKKESMSLLDYSDFGFGPSASQMDLTSVDTYGYYLQDHLKLLDSFFATAGVRIDDHETFGTNTSYQVNGSYIIPLINTRLKGLYGTGFKAPSLYQLYAPIYGNADLKPEESASYEFGFEQPLWGERVVIEGTYFNARYTNMFGFDSSFKTINIGKVDTRGIEAAAMFTVLDSLRLDGVYTYTEAEDKTTGEQLVRRPEHQGSINVNWMFIRGGNINLGMIYVGKRKDVWYDSTFTEHEVTLDDYFTIDLNASYWVTSFLQVFGKVINLSDEDYQAVVGYNTPGRSYYAGVKGAF